MRLPYSVGSKIKQGFVELPLAEVTLEDAEMIQQCAKCGRWETSETLPRFRRCSKCKRRYYVSFYRQSVSLHDRLGADSRFLPAVVLYRGEPVARHSVDTSFLPC